MPFSEGLRRPTKTMVTNEGHRTPQNKKDDQTFKQQQFRKKTTNSKNVDTHKVKKRSSYDQVKLLHAFFNA